MARQKGNLINAAIPAVASTIAEGETALSPAVTVADPKAPVRKINTQTMTQLGMHFKGLFDRYSSERMPTEQRYLRNLRQYLGEYDPEILNQLAPNRSRAYPRLTRVKCVSMLSRLMNLMFPGNEDNWELKASPSPEMSPESVAEAVNKLMTELRATDPSLQLTQEIVEQAVRQLSDDQAKQLSDLIKDQLMEIGGDQTHDWIAHNRRVVDSGIKYGIGVLEGPYVRKIQESGWVVADTDPTGAITFKPQSRSIYKPQYDFLPVWDFYPDMTSRDLPGEGYFVRKIFGRSKLRKLADRKDFSEKQIKAVITAFPAGNYKTKSWETELRSMGLSINAETTSNQSTGREKYEVIIWKGPVSAQKLVECGADVPDKMLADDVEAELWMVDNYIIKAEINAWRQLGIDMKQVHIFSFDEDDTSPVGQGLPQIVRDSQLSICAATRMALDNASVTCGPNLEVNTRLMRPDQDLTAVTAHKIWYRDDDGLSAQFPAVRELKFDGHLNELQGLIKMFVDFAEMETFIGPSTGGDFQKQPSEPMRTAAGASMLRGDAALPFKDIVRNYDSFTQSVIVSMVSFNKKFNPEQAPEGDYDVIARGATSLIAKEMRGMQIDALSQTLTPEERDHVDERKFVEAKFSSRDMQGMLVSVDEATRRKSARAEELAKQAQMQERQTEEQIRNISSDTYKNIAQGQKNAANADQTGVKTALEVISNGEEPNDNQSGDGGARKQAAGGG